MNADIFVKLDIFFLSLFFNAMTSQPGMKKSLLELFNDGDKRNG